MTNFGLNKFHSGFENRKKEHLENWIKTTNNPASASWTVQGTPTIVTGLADPFGGTKAFSIVDDSISYERVLFASDTGVGGKRVNFSFYVKRDAATTGFVLFRVQLDTIANRVDFKYNPVDDAINVIAYGTAVLFNSAVKKINDDWARVWFDGEATAGTFVTLDLFPVVGTPASFPNLDATISGINTFYGPQLTTIDPGLPHRFLENLGTTAPVSI